MKDTEQRLDPFETHPDRNFPEDYSQENGNYINKCKDCEMFFRGNKHRIWCKICEQPNWEQLAKIQRPELPNPIPGAWLQGEMVGYARCMIKKVKPLTESIASLTSQIEQLQKSLELERVECDNGKATIEQLRKENGELRKRCNLNYGGGFTDEEVNLASLRYLRERDLSTINQQKEEMADLANSIRSKNSLLDEYEEELDRLRDQKQTIKELVDALEVSTRHIKDILAYGDSKIGRDNLRKSIAIADPILSKAKKQYNV
jgi:hypothetical protein